MKCCERPQFLSSLRMGPLSYSVRPWQDLPANCKGKLAYWVHWKVKKKYNFRHFIFVYVFVSIQEHVLFNDKRCLVFQGPIL
jgi:hypothetical protein